MHRRVDAREPGWKVRVEQFTFGQWDAFVRHRTGEKVGEDELVPGGPFPSQAEARRAGMAYARTKQ